MVSGRKTDQLIVIVGPTASGKSALGIRVAQDFNGEIISADSRTIYKGLNIGTAKPSLLEQNGIKHFGFDLIDVSTTFSAAEFQKRARVWIKDIHAREHLPIVVGGTGLYVDSILFDYKFGEKVNAERRAELEAYTIEELWEHCKSNNIKLPENYKNKRYVVRAIEQRGINSIRRDILRNETIVVGLSPPKEVLLQKVRERAQTIFNNNVVKEATQIAKYYGWSTPGLSGNIYPILYDFINNNTTKHEAIERSITADWHLAKRQLTWFKRNPFVQWSETPEQAYAIIKEYLSKSA